MRKLRAVIAGAGLIALKKHIPAFLENRDKVELVAVCDLNLQNAHEAARLMGIAKVYDDFSRMLASETPDVVDICTPPRTHASLAVQAIKHGCHTLIEKPLALDLDDCDAILNAARDYKVKGCVVHSDLFYWPFLRAQELVARGRLGAFRGMRILLSTPTSYMTSQSNHWAHKLPGGVLGETGPHAVYMTLAFINPIREVCVHAKKILNYGWSPFEDYRIELIGDQGISSVTLSYSTKQWMARVEILGDNGMIIADLEAMSMVRYQRRQLTPISIGLSLMSESTQLLGNLFCNGLSLATGRLKSTHDVILRRFAECILRGTEPPVTLDEGREAVRANHMIVERLNETYG